MNEIQLVLIKSFGFLLLTLIIGSCVFWMGGEVLKLAVLALRRIWNNKVLTIFVVTFLSASVLLVLPTDFQKAEIHKSSTLLKKKSRD